jgi:toxin ParE1/3/4
LRALEDVRSIHAYISKDSKAYADRYIDKLISRVDQLEKNSTSGRVVPEFNIESIRELMGAITGSFIRSIRTSLQ